MVIGESLPEYRASFCLAQGCGGREKMSWAIENSTQQRRLRMYHKIVIAVSAIALAAAMSLSTPKPAEAFFIAPIAIAGVIAGSMLLGAGAGSMMSSESWTHGDMKCKMGSTYDPRTGRFDGGWAKVCR
jgi:hypothetical protein